jgi:chorismate dehydratase
MTRSGTPVLSLGEIAYANCLPIQEPFRERWEREYRFTTREPADINRLLRAGEVDCAPASSIEYAHHPDLYWIVPDLSIGADGPARSVVLMTPVPVAELDGQEIYLTPASATSVVLLKILLEQVAGVHPCYVEGVPGDPHLPHLLIGDHAMRRFYDPPPGIDVVDLGSWWKEVTDLPMVFALWLLRREAAAREPAASRQLAARLGRMRHEMDAARLAALANRFAGREFSADRLLAYWHTLSYALTDRHRAGLARFYELARETGAVDQVPSLDLYPEAEVPLPATGSASGP